MIAFSKKADFYFQREAYLALDDASAFLKQLIEQFEGKELCGFYWPKRKELDSRLFVKKVIPALFFRKRAIHPEEIQRFVRGSAAFQEGIAKNKSALLKAYKSLYDHPFWEEIELKKAD